MLPRKQPTRWVAGWLALLVFGVYGNALRTTFLLDDLNLVVDNAFIRHWRFLPEIFSHGLFQASGAISDFYRPLQTVTYLLTYQLWGLNPIGYHLTNVILHIINAVLLYLLIVKLSGTRVAALAASTLFAVHPVHTQAVTYISGTADLLVAACCLLSLLCYIRAQQARSALLLSGATAGCFGLALLSKEVALLFPLIVMAYDVSFLRTRSSWGLHALMKRYVPLLMIGGAYLWLRSSLPHLQPLYRVSQQLSLLERLWTALAHLWTSLRLIFVPLHLHMFYRTEPVYHFLHPRVYLAGLLLLAVSWAIVRTLRISPVRSFYGLWILTWFLPMLNLVPLNAFVAEHWLYLPLMGLAAFAATTLGCRLQTVPMGRVGAGVGCLTLVAILGTLTVRQNRVWKDPLTFLSYSIRHVPDRPMLYLHLGDAWLVQKEAEKALEAYQKALELNPGFYPALAKLGFYYTVKGDYTTAKEWYERALETPTARTNPVLHNDIGALYLKLGDVEASLTHFEQAVSLHPYHAAFWTNMGRAATRLGQLEDAAEAFQHALRLDPQDIAVYKHVADICFLQGRYDEAVAHYQRAVQGAPDPQLYVNLGIAYFKLQAYERAEAAWRNALKLNPQSEEARANLQLVQRRKTP